jgi:MFS family permease
MSLPPSTVPPARPSKILLIFLGMLCTLVTVVFARLAYGLVLPFMRADLGLSYAQAANLGTVTALGYLILLMYAGIFAGRYGGRRAILCGLFFACLGFFGLSLSTHYSLLLFFMTLLGFGTAFAYTPLISLLGSWYPENRGTVIGFTSSGVGLGMLISGAMVPALAELFGSSGWRMVWVLFGISAIITGVLIALFLREPVRNGDAVSVRTGLATVYRSPHVIVMGLIYGIVGITYIVQTLFMYSFALDAQVPALTAGRLVSMMGFISIFAGPAWGWVADRLGHAKALVVCMSLAMVATLAPVIRPETSVFFFHYLLMGLSVSGLFTSILAASTSTVKPQHAAMAVSFVTLFFAIGQLLGPALAGLLIEWQQDFRLSFLISTALLAAGIALSHFSRRFV